MAMYTRFYRANKYRGVSLKVNKAAGRLHAPDHFGPIRG
jgi:hypothetical protein